MDALGGIGVEKSRVEEAETNYWVQDREWAMWQKCRPTGLWRQSLVSGGGCKAEETDS